MNKNNLHLLDQTYMKKLNKYKRLINGESYMHGRAGVSEFDFMFEMQSELTNQKFSKEQVRMRISQARPGLRKLLEFFHRVDD